MIALGLVALLVAIVTDKLWQLKHAKLVEKSAATDEVVAGLTARLEVERERTISLLHVSESRIHQLEDTNISLEEQRQTMYDLMLQMKREGWSQPGEPVQLLPVNGDGTVGQPRAKLPAVVRAAIEGVASPGEPLYAQLEAQALNDLESVEDATPDAVAASITKGSNYQPYE